MQMEVTVFLAPRYRRLSLTFNRAHCYIEMEVTTFLAFRYR